MTMLKVLIAFALGVSVGVALSPTIKYGWKLFTEGVSELLDRRKGNGCSQ